MLATIGVPSLDALFADIPQDALQTEINLPPALSELDMLRTLRQMAAIMAMYPMLKQGMERMQREGTKLQGTPLATTTTFEAVKSKEQMSQESQNKESGGGGIGGMLGRKIMKRDNEVKPRATIMTLTNEVQEISTSVSPADLDLPAGFKQK